MTDHVHPVPLQPLSELVIDGQRIGEQHPTYFIADVAANHDGDLERAKDLIYMAKQVLMQPSSSISVPKP